MLLLFKEKASFCERVKGWIEVKGKKKEIKG